MLFPRYIARWSRSAAIVSAVAMLVVMHPVRGLCAVKSDESFFALARSIDLLGEVYREVSRNYVDPVDASEFMYSGIDGMLDQLDPYTAFLDESQTGELDEITTGRYAGIGITLGMISGKLYITSVIEGHAASKAGLRTGDCIVAVNGEKVSRKPIDEVRNTIKGAAGTAVRLSISRYGQGASKLYTLVRAEVMVPTVPYYGLFGSTGYIQMNSFGENSGDELRSAIRALQKDAERDRITMNGMVIDLRGNPGGLLNSAVEVVSLFVGKGSRVVSTRGRTAESEQVFVTKNEPLVASLPLVVLIDGDTASASEIVAGAIQELDRGVILGEVSYGKGLVQSVMTLPYDHSLKLTTAKYYTPSGRLIQKPLARQDSHRKVLLSSDTCDSTRVYFTRNRRKVYGGGGVKPDVTVKAESPSEYRQALEKEGLIFRYATRFHLRHPGFQVQQLPSEPLFDDFSHFVSKEGFVFRSHSQLAVDSLKTLIHKEQGKDEPALASRIEALEKELGAWTLRRIAKDSVRIDTAVRQEIVRHIDERAAMRQAIQEDSVAAKAFSLLGDQKRYQSLLRP